jgi:hypothetical protein
MILAHKVIITGTGRAGTTFLVRLLTELGLDTGYTPEAARGLVDAHSRAGLEHELALSERKPTVRDWLRQPKHTFRALWRGPKRTPYIIKNPALCDTLSEVVASRRLVIDHVYVPLRDLEAAALSRARVGGANGSQPGGLWKTGDPGQQKAVLAEMFFKLVYTLEVYDLPHTYLLFPRLVEDWVYTYDKLGFLVKDVPVKTFRATFARVADRHLVHEFSVATGPQPSGAREPEAEGPASEDHQRRPGAWWRFAPGLRKLSGLGVPAHQAPAR